MTSLTDNLRIKNLGIILINSTVMFLLAWFVVIVSSNLFSILLIKSLGFQSVLYHYGFFYSNDTWSRDDIVIVYVLGYMWNIALAVIAERWYKTRRKYASPWNLLLLWIYILSVTWLLGSLMAGTYFNFGLGAGLRALGIPLIIRVVLGILGVALLVFLGLRSRNHLIISAGSYLPSIEKSGLTRFMLAQAFLPALLGLIIVFLYKIPHQGAFQYLDFLIFLTIFLFFTGALFQNNKFSRLRFRRKKANIRLRYLPLILCLLILVLSRMLLAKGISL